MLRVDVTVFHIAAISVCAAWDKENVDHCLKPAFGFTAAQILWSLIFLPNVKETCVKFFLILCYKYLFARRQHLTDRLLLLLLV